MADSLVPLRKKLPAVYDALLPELFDRPEIPEPRATCDNCAMCDHGEGAPVNMDYFNERTKCCTFHPKLANYLVGAVLADTNEDLAEGRARLRAKIAARIGVTPQYIAGPRMYSVIYAAGRGGSNFGRADKLICPYYADDGRCTVWRFREAVCSTWFCKYSAGRAGQVFWSAVKEYLSHAEQRLAYHLACSVDKTVTEPTTPPLSLTREDIDGLPPPDADYAVWWGNGAWVGREEEFYIACYERMKVLDKAHYAEHIDDAPAGRGLLAKLEAKYDDIVHPKLPTTLIRATNLKKREAGENVVVTTYSPYDSFSLEKELFDVLGMLEPTQTLEENLARLDKVHDIQLAPELIAYLYKFGVLADPAVEKAAKRVAEVKARAANPAAQSLAMPEVLQPARKVMRARKKKTG
jgi:hypothetical protein